MKELTLLSLVCGAPIWNGHFMNSSKLPFAIDLNWIAPLFFFLKFLYYLFSCLMFMLFACSISAYELPIDIVLQNLHFKLRCCAERVVDKDSNPSLYVGFWQKFTSLVHFNFDSTLKYVFKHRLCLKVTHSLKAPLAIPLITHILCVFGVLHISALGDWLN